MATRLKSPAKPVQVPQSKEECAAAIRQLGDLQRMRERQRADMNDLIAAVTQQHQPILSDLGARIDALFTGVQTWCEAHRQDLCGPGDKLGKTANLVTGEVSWRQRPPKAVVRDAEGVMDELRVMGLEKFIRAKYEVNKEAVLADPDAVRGITGLTVVIGEEDFVVVPFEVAAEGV